MLYNNNVPEKQSQRDAFLLQCKTFFSYFLTLILHKQELSTRFVVNVIILTI